MTNNLDHPPSPCSHAATEQEVAFFSFLSVWRVDLGAGFAAFHERYFRVWAPFGKGPFPPACLYNKVP